MDKSQQYAFNEASRKKIYDNLADVLITALENGKATQEDEIKSAEFILQELEKVKNKKDLLIFLKRLTDQWPIYDPVYVKILDEDAKVEVQKKIEEIKKQII